MSDSNIDAVREKMKRRELAGFDKYGVSINRADLSAEQWLQHLQEELMDACVYTERMFKELSALRARVAELEKASNLGLVAIKSTQLESQMYESRWLDACKEREKAEREQDEATHYLARLLTGLYPECEPLPSLIGVCTQIDNILAGLVIERDEAQAELARVLWLVRRVLTRTPHSMCGDAEAWARLESAVLENHEAPADGTP